MNEALRICIWVAAAALAMIVAGTSCADPLLVYSEDWRDGDSGWSNALSYDHGPRPARIYIGHPAAPYIQWFYGGCGWGFRWETIPKYPMWIKIYAMVFGMQRNALSVNVRTEGGAPIYKYGFCAGRIGANKQPPTFTYQDTDLTYRTEIPYELTSLWIPDTGCFALALKNLLTGEERVSNRLWLCRSRSVPGWIDFDQEGGQGPVALARIDVYAGW